jgi:aldose 1-epimerase
MQILDGSEISVAIDLDQGGRIASLQWRDLQFVVPFRGSALSWGWYPMAPWAGRVKNGLLKDKSGKEIQLPTNITPPHAIHGYGLTSAWEEIGRGKSQLELPGVYRGAVVTQHIEVLDDAVRWILEYEANGCDLPAWLGFHPWFPRELERGGSAEVEFHPGKMFERIDGLPTGKLVSPVSEPWDDCFTEVSGTPAITWEGAARIDIDSDVNYWVVYTEDPDGVCVEPQTAPPDAANLGIVGDHYLETLFTFSEGY